MEGRAVWLVLFFSSSTMKVNLSQTNKGWIDKMVKHLFPENFTSESMSMFRCSSWAVYRMRQTRMELPDFFPYANVTAFLNLLRFFSSLYIPANGCKRPTRPVLVLFLLLLVFLPFLLHACQLAQLFMSCYGHKSPPFAPPPFFLRLKPSRERNKKHPFR